MLVIIFDQNFLFYQESKIGNGRHNLFAKAEVLVPLGVHESCYEQ